MSLSSLLVCKRQHYLLFQVPKPESIPDSLNAKRPLVRIKATSPVTGDLI